MLSPIELYEMEMAIYQSELAKWEQLQMENPPYLFLLAKPEPPQMMTFNRHWDMRKVVTSSRRKWK